MPIIKLKETESFDAGLRRFKRSCDKAGVIAEVRKREFYEKPTAVRKRKAAAAVKELLKDGKWEQCRLLELDSELIMSQELLTSIQEDVKSSLKSGNKFKASTLRLIVSAIKLEEKNKSELLSNTEALEILSKMIKQRKDSIDQFETANRLELAEKEKKKLK